MTYNLSETNISTFMAEILCIYLRDTYLHTKDTSPSTIRFLEDIFHK